MKSIFVKGIILIVSLAILSVTGFFIVKAITKTTEEGIKAPEKIVNALSACVLGGLDIIVNPRPQDNSRPMELIIHGDERTANLITVERTFEHTYSYSTTWRGSKKEIILSATFRAFGGVDMSGEPVTIYFSPEGKASADMRGRGKLIACEKVMAISIEDKGGVWNRINEEDRVFAENDLLASAKKRIEKETDLTKKAEENFIPFLEERSKNLKGESQPIHLPPLL